MAKIRVMLVDDSIVIRRVVTEELTADAEIEVLATAANGKIALAKLAQAIPDLVILDVEMPEMDGLATLAAIRKSHPRLPVIMFSAITERGASATLDALALGASDYFTKPSGSGGLEESRQVIRTELIPAIKEICHAQTPRSRFQWSAPSHQGADRVYPIEVIVIGTSTGGPNALTELFSGLPGGLPVPILIVQHMPPMFTRLLAERLAANTRIPTSEGVQGQILVPGQAIIAPGGFHLELTREGLQTKVVLHEEARENSCRPSADPLFRSAAKLYGPGVLAVVLTGMGQDGLRGCERIRDAGGTIFAQDEASSVVWGMPGAVARAGLAHKVLPLTQMAPEILRRVCGGAVP